MSSGKRRLLPSSDPLYILGLLDRNSSDESDSDLYSDSDDEQPSGSPKAPNSSFQSYETAPSTTSFQRYQAQSSTSSFQSYEAPTSMCSLQSSNRAMLASSPTLASSSNSGTSSFQSYTLQPSTTMNSCSLPSPPPLPPPMVIPTSSSTATRSCVESSTSCNSSTGNKL